jgi:putative ABC transport system substrate-binding protein
VRLSGVTILQEEFEMKKLNKVLALVLAGVMTLALAACGGGAGAGSAADAAASTADAAASAAASAVDSDKTYTVGICQLVQHPALDAATKGFKDALTEKLGDKVTFDEQNAAGDSPTCTTICTGFVSSKVDLIMANATPALTAAASATDSIPILGTSVTDYGSALDIKDWTGTTGKNISGTTDLAPLDEQAKMVKELCPEAKNAGILYCSAEANSKYQATEVKKQLEDLGLTVTEYTFADSNDVASVTQSACDANDVLYVPTDNTAASCAEAINNVATPAKTPIIAGEEGICQGCGIATLSIDYYDLGKATGEMAYEVLVNGADISTMEVQTAPQFTYKYMKDRCAELGITVPDTYEEIA